MGWSSKKKKKEQQWRETREKVVRVTSFSRACFTHERHYTSEIRCSPTWDKWSQGRRVVPSGNSEGINTRHEWLIDVHSIQAWVNHKKETSVRPTAWGILGLQKWRNSVILKRTSRTCWIAKLVSSLIIWSSEFLSLLPWFFLIIIGHTHFCSYAQVSQAVSLQESNVYFTNPTSSAE